MAWPADFMVADNNLNPPVNDISNPEFGYGIVSWGRRPSLPGSLAGAGSSPPFIEIKGIIRF